MGHGSAPTSQLLKAPFEIRQNILELLLVPAPRTYNEDVVCTRKTAFRGKPFWIRKYSCYGASCNVQILRVCRTIYKEGVHILYNKNVFNLSSFARSSLFKIGGPHQPPMLTQDLDMNFPSIIKQWHQIRHIDLLGIDVLDVFTVVALKWLLLDGSSILDVLGGLPTPTDNINGFKGGKQKFSLPHIQSLRFEHDMMMAFEFPLWSPEAMLLPKTYACQSYLFGRKLNRHFIKWPQEKELQRLLEKGIPDNVGFATACILGLTGFKKQNGTMNAHRVFALPAGNCSRESTLITKEKLPSKMPESWRPVNIQKLLESLENMKRDAQPSRIGVDENTQAQTRLSVDSYLDFLERGGGWYFMGAQIW